MLGELSRLRKARSHRMEALGKKHRRKRGAIEKDQEGAVLIRLWVVAVTWTLT